MDDLYLLYLLGFICANMARQMVELDGIIVLT